MITIPDPAPVSLVSIQQAEMLIGYSAKAIRRKIEDGVWLEGYEYYRAPDHRIHIDLVGYMTWVKGERRVGRS